MAHSDSTKLRLASDKSGAGIRKKDPLEIDEFLEKWRYQLKTPGTEWEEPLAVAQLRRKKMFEFLLCDRKGKYEWQAEDLFIRIVDEMKAYRDEAKVRLVREYYDDADEFLNGLIRKIGTKEIKSSVPELKSQFQDLRENVQQTRKTVNWLRKKKKGRHFGIWQNLWKKVPRNNMVSTKAKLDARLQIELGKMFSYYLRPKGITLETIARLIVLAYWAGGLCGMDGDVIRTIHTGRELKVRNIRENLRGVNLHKAAGYKWHSDKK